ncbi:MAG: ribosome maturation factor RimM, partial [Pseudomonadota bacterium]|nr:ribosome maturation factor RimM [Pseudomonadota bacterium]
ITMTAASDNPVCIAQIARPHGVRGLVTIRPFTADPSGVTAYDRLFDAKGNTLMLEWHGRGGKGNWIARIEGIATREAAAALSGSKLHVRRADLPDIDQEDTFYHVDLIGLRAVSPDGAMLGKIVAVDNFGGGDILQIRTKEGTTLALPFAKAFVPEVDMAGRRMVVIVPSETLAQAEDDA